MRLHLALVSTFLVVGGFAAIGAEKQTVNSERSACVVLKRGAVKYRLSTHNMSGRYYCSGFDAARYPPGYFVLALRVRELPEDKWGSDLVGFFAVRRSDGALFEFDANDDTVKPLQEPSEW